MANDGQKYRDPHLRRHGWRSRGAIVGAVTVIAVAATTQRDTIRASLFPVHDMAAIAKAMDRAGYRVIEARLSGDFPYRELKRTLRGTPKHSIPAVSPALLRDLHAQGVFELVYGDPADAIQLLERALTVKEKPLDIDAAASPGTLIDLSAAYYERAVRDARPLDLVRAFSAASRAIEIAPRTAEGWNIYALVLERLHLRQDAVDAWKTYLTLDATSPWAAEARAHLKQLEQPPFDIQELRNAAERNDVARVRTLVESAPQKARTTAEEQLLGEWGDAIARHDFAVARSRVQAAVLIGRALLDSGFDAMAYDAATHAAGTTSANADARARAYRTYRDARTAQAKKSDHKSRVAMQEAARLLDETGSPLQPRAAVYAATLAHYAGDNDEAKALLQTTIASLQGKASRYPLVLGQAYWARGHIQYVSGHPHQALLFYAQAHPFLARARETSNLAGIEGVLAETYRYLGDPENAWLHYLLALQAMDADATYLRRQAGMADAAMAALQADQWRLGELLARRVARNAALENDSVFEAVASWNLALINRKRARLDEAQQQLQRGAEILGRLPPDPSTAPLEADIAIERGELLTSTNPAAAIALLDEARVRLQSIGRHPRMPQLCLAASRARDALGDAEGAERELRTGIDELEQQRSGLAADDQRSTFTDTGRALYDALVQRLVDEKRPDAALVIARRARMSSLAASPDAGIAALRGLTLIEYYVLPNALLMWATANGRTRFERKSLPSTSLRSMVERTTATIADCSDVAQCNRAATELYELLLEPLAPWIADETSLVLAPDGALHRVPFAALRNPHTGRYLVEDYAITIAIGGPVAPESEETYRSILVAAAPNPPGELVRLDAVAAEAKHAARNFRRFRVLDEQDANANRFLAELRNFDVAHFAGHATSNERQPRLSSLHFAAAPDRPDGMLYAYEIPPGAFPRTRLLVLAACGTADGKLAGSGLLGFARTFIAAGVPRVIGTLWSVDDGTSASLFADFYRVLANEKSASDALRDAQRAAIASSDFSPRTWAAYQLYGSL